MEIETKINLGNLKKAIKALAQKYSVKVGLLANSGGSDYVSDNLDMAGLGAAHEFGAEIEHPGGTPYFINEFGMATFVKKDSFYGQLLVSRGQVTKPHHISIPARPWLSMPLSRNNGTDIRKKIKKYAGDAGFIEDMLFLTDENEDIATMIGVAGLEQIMEAFESQGFGEWQPNAPATIAKKGSEDPLINFGRFKGAVNYKVEQHG